MQLRAVATDPGSGPPEGSCRILVVAPQPFYQDRGTPIALRKVLEAASSRGYRIDLITYPIGEPIELPGLRILRAGRWFPIRNVPIGFSMKKVFLDLCLLPLLLKRTRRVRYEFVYALEEAAFLVLAVNRWHRLPLIYDMQSSLPDQLKAHPVLGARVPQRVLKSIERWMVRKAERVVCSAGLRDHVLSLDPSADVREWIFPYEVFHGHGSRPDGLRKELGIDARSGVVLYAGNFERYQGVERLLEAALDVVSVLPDTVFVLVGEETPSRIVGSKAAARLQDKGALRVIRRQPRSEIPRYLEMADLLVSPRDDTANVGIKIFEYMAAGKPIVATDTPAHRAVLDESRAALVDCSARAMAEAILRLLRDRIAARALGEAARSYAENRLGESAFADRVADLYDLGRNGYRLERLG